MVADVVVTIAESGALILITPVQCGAAVVTVYLVLGVFKLQALGFVVNAATYTRNTVSA